MNVYRESSRSILPRTFRFRQRGAIGPALLAIVMAVFLAAIGGVRVHVTCSRAADECDWDSFGLGPEHGSARVSTIGALLVERSGDVSHLAFATTHGHVALVHSSDNIEEREKADLAARFDKWLTSGEESFDDGYGPPFVLIAAIVLALFGAAVWVARGGAAARVVVEPQSEMVTVERRAKPWFPAEKRTFEKARLRAWKGAFELYDEAGNVVPLPVSTSDARGKELAALLTYDG